MAFLAVYFTVVILFFRSSSSDAPQSTSETASAEAHVIDNDLEEPKDFAHHVVARELNAPDAALEPFFTEGIPGNYEPKNVVQRTGPGEGGEGVKLEGEDIKLGEQSVAEYGFNEVASDKISLDRRARDTR